MEEKEYKVMLSLEEYNDILNQFDWESYIRQCNYYYDSKTFWAETYGYTIRIREINGSITLQIKSPNTSRKAYKSRTEHETAINHIPEYLYTAGLQPIKDKSNRPERLDLLGCLETERYIKHLSDDIVVFLDRNKYYDVVDYEIEVEFSNDNKPAEGLLLGLGLKPSKSPGKYTRFVMCFTNPKSLDVKDFDI